MIITFKNCNIISCYIICTLVFHQVLSQDSKEIVASRAQTCRSPGKKPGNCIKLRKCEPILNLLREDSAIGQQALIQLRCSGNSERYRICCPETRSNILKPVAAARPIKANSNSNKTPLAPPQCGFSNARHDRVVGGNPSELGAWPWLGLLGYGVNPSSNELSYKCGGALISSRTVVTAAHCVHGQNDLRVVRLGEHNLQSDDDGAHPRDFPIETKIVHPHYNPSTNENDIAILKLIVDVSFTSAVHPICLPVSDDMRNRDFVHNLPFIAGWGYTSWHGTSSAELLEAQVPVIDLDTCRNQYQGVQNAVIDSRIICAGYAQGGKDACQGDSGGPLMFPMQNTYYMIGVISGGYRCAEAGYSGLYTRVSSFLDFILQYID